MNFIKEGFFREKNVDTGKIFFRIENNDTISHFRADIKDSRATEQRLKLYDDNNTSIDYKFIEKNINKKYFEQGFHINLDDLMNIQNKSTSTLIDTIKDPSGEKLTSFVEEKKAEAKKILGEKGRLTKETSIILDKISGLNKTIKELSSMELQYNNSINQIKSLSEECNILCKKEEMLKLLSEEKEIEQKLNSVEKEYTKLKLNFNDKLFNEKEIYLNVIHNAGKYESDLNVLEKNKNKLDLINSKINADLHNLNNNFTLNLNEKDICNYSLDYSKIKQIKDLAEEKNSLEKELIAFNTEKENIEETLLKLKHEISDSLLKTEDLSNLEVFKDLYNFIDEGIKKYNFLLIETDKSAKSTISNSAKIKNNILIFIFCILIIITGISIYLSFKQNLIFSDIFSIITAVLSAFGIFYLTSVNHKNNKNSEITKNETYKTDLLNSLKDKLRSFYPDIDNTEITYLPYKIENIKQEIQNKIQNLSNIKNQIEKNQSDSAYNKEKYNNTNDKSIKVKDKINSIETEIHNLINSQNPEYNINSNIYSDVIDIIKTLKDNIEEKTAVLKEIEYISLENEKIINNLNTFIIENSINITISEKYEENVQNLKIYNDKNNEVKRNLEVLNIEIQDLKSQKEQLEKATEKFTDFSREEFNSNIELKTEEIRNEKENKLQKINEAEYIKRDLEKVKGLDNLKTEKNILLDEYRKKVSELIKNKMIISLIETAKNNFDKTRPSLRNAQKYFSILTDKKYSIINLELEEVQNEDKTVTKKWDNLSRGTREQLYLALRLGYASNYSKDKVTLEPNGKADLPLIIDDAFVNFDEQRTANAIKCLLEFSKTNQVFYFTCRTEAVKKAEETLNCREKLNIINM